MATLVFGTLGTLAGGPLGGAIGSLIGRELDRSILGGPVRAGPRLKELAISTSSYGQPIARLFGATRAAGTIIWASDLKESSETASGGKGRPRTKEYSYSASLAIALSSLPIQGVGRIWADGNLLRGEAGDLKTGGSLRVHLGHADQEADPVLAGALGEQCPAHRGLAYVVLEDLELGEFGNRIPALSFEVFADGAGENLVAALSRPVLGSVQALPVAACAPIAGFAHEGGSIAASLAALGETVPLVANLVDTGLAVGGEPSGADAPVLPDAIAWSDGEFGTRTGRRVARGLNAVPTALRYYDLARGYQPGIQRAPRRAWPGGERTLELAASLDAAGAALLIARAAAREAARTETARARIASLDPRFAPGQIVALPGEGLWRIEAWEWRSGGLELELVRSSHLSGAPGVADPGTPWHPVDRPAAPSVLHAFELPWDGAGASGAARLHLAVGSGPGRWAGAALYVERGGALVPIWTTERQAAVTGVLAASLAGSPALMFEPGAAVEVDCDNATADLVTVDGPSLAAGANRLLIGGEIVQFLTAEKLAERRWRLTGLLRGRGASEEEARAGHPVGARVVLLDHRLQLFDATLVDPATERLAAIGAGDLDPVFASLTGAGRSRQPLTPVHPIAVLESDGSLALEWTRRARGAWAWAESVVTPLVEEGEEYEVGAGPVGSPVATWICVRPGLTLGVAELAPLGPGTQLWVRQVGTYGRSPALLLHTRA